MECDEGSCTRLIIIIKLDFAPFERAFVFHNTGFLVGHSHQTETTGNHEGPDDRLNQFYAYVRKSYQP